MNTTITLSFCAFRPDVQKSPLSPHDVEQIRLLALAHPDMRLTVVGLPCDNYSGYADDELDELLSAYSRLEMQVLLGKQETHTAFFGQGGLLISADVCPEQTIIEIDRSLHLDKRLTTRHRLEVPTFHYLAAWRNVLHSLLDSLSDLQSGP